MFRNYLRTGFRHIIREKAYSLINVLGLSTAICVCIIIFLINSYEFSFDSFHREGNRVYRIVGHLQRGGGPEEFLNSPTSEVAGIEHAIPGFEEKAAIHFFESSVTIEEDGKEARRFDTRNEVVITGPAYFNIFHYEWLAGNKSTALSEPFHVVLTEKKGRKYFGDVPVDQIIGKTVIYNDSLKAVVTGVVKDWNKNTDLSHTDFISLATAGSSFLKAVIPTADWRSLVPHQSMAFVKLEKGSHAKDINQKLNQYIKAQVTLPVGDRLSMVLQPLDEIHFTNDPQRADDGDYFRKAYLPNLYLLSGIALFILALAVVNFINLSTAICLRRAKETGIRKILGGRRYSLVFQFLLEAFLITLCSVAIAALVVNPALQWFQSFIPDGVRFQLFSAPTISFLFFITIITTLAAGLYPAFVLASYTPVQSLKTGSYKGSTGYALRKGLIVFQFAISVVFIIGAIVVNSQIRYMYEKDKGFDTDAIITVNNWGAGYGTMQALVGKLNQVIGVEEAILQGSAPMGFAHRFTDFRYNGDGGALIQVSLEIGDENFIPFYGMKLLAGRNLVSGDSMNVVLINETLSKTMGFQTPDKAIGSLLHANNKALTVGGVVRDFHEGSFHEKIQPVVIQNVPEWQQSIAIKLASQKTAGRELTTILSRIEKEWKTFYPERPFDYTFLNDSIKWLYEREEKTAKLVHTAMGITIFISCMGLFGLAMFTASLKTKEIGIRKVLGASVTNITLMLSRDFIKLVLLSFIIASPIAWYFMNQWLQDFVYRIHISWWMFVLAGASAIVIAWATVSFHSIQAAITNPVETLRIE